MLLKRRTWLSTLINKEEAVDGSGYVEFHASVADLIVSMRNQNVKRTESPFQHFIGGWKRALDLYETGTFHVINTRNGILLRYDLRFLYGFLFCFVGSSVIGLFALATGEITASGAFWLTLFAFSWLYGANCILAYFRVPTLLIQTVLDSEDNSERNALKAT